MDSGARGLKVGWRRQIGSDVVVSLNRKLYCGGRGVILSFGFGAWGQVCLGNARSHGLLFSAVPMPRLTGSKWGIGEYTLGL